MHIHVIGYLNCRNLTGDRSLLQEYDGGKASLDYFRNSTDTQLHNMYVTAKNIDETSKRLSFTLSEAINIALDMGQEE